MLLQDLKSRIKHRITTFLLVTASVFYYQYIFQHPTLFSFHRINTTTGRLITQQKQKAKFQHKTADSIASICSYRYADIIITHIHTTELQPVVLEKDADHRIAAKTSCNWLIKFNFGLVQVSENNNEQVSCSRHRKISHKRMSDQWRTFHNSKFWVFAIQRTINNTLLPYLLSRGSCVGVKIYTYT